MTSDVRDQLAEVVEEFEKAERRLDRLVAETPDERWSVRADPERWSVAECIAHLNLTGAAYVPVLEAAVEQARTLPPLGDRRYRRDPVGWLLAIATGPLPRIGSLRFGRGRTATRFVPSGELDRETVVAAFKRLQTKQIELTRAGDGLPLDRVKVTSPFDARVRYNLYSCLVMLPGHQHRHLEQAEEVWPRQRAREPASPMG